MASSIIGLVAGLGIAKGLNSLFLAFGIDIPNVGLVLETRTIMVALLVGIGATLVSSLMPAIRATRVPPIAALREGADWTMFHAARLRLTAWYLLILAIIAAVLSFGLYRLLLLTQEAELHAVQPGARHPLVHAFAHDEVILAYQIVGVDLGVLLLAAVGAYLLAGRTLRPIEEAMERQRRFATAASHELRTPLTALQGNLEVALLKPRTTDEYEQLLRDAVADTQRMGHLVKDLTLLARPEVDRTVLRIEPIDLRDAASTAVRDVELLAADKGQRLEVALDGPLLVQGDAARLRQVFVKLLENAIRYTPKGGEIRLVGKRESVLLGGRRLTKDAQPSQLAGPSLRPQQALLCRSGTRCRGRRSRATAVSASGPGHRRYFGPYCVQN